MNKIISNPFECSYCNIEENYRDIYCKHPNKKETIVCANPKEFPINCPLQDGMTIKEHLDSVLKMHKKPGDLIKLHRKKSRNRKNCIHYTPKGRCKENETIAGNYPKCIGVVCCCFKSKKE